MTPVTWIVTAPARFTCDPMSLAEMPCPLTPLTSIVVVEEAPAFTMPAVTVRMPDPLRLLTVIVVGPL
ncbi:hypothetical protein FUT87_02925 [Mitsuaria sp. TWR114]|uniref:hypothetical protein n=1 Tax=Mitsuaria sp. TWR114 TaxID=2601731 RepID=UPI0011BF2AC8|nr:hypothetical protein [Mitsuaria sp. TWR114]TXD99429.1 hypothetical protein FUT87_02925 [Mitsuaria sp. TWR114]